MMKAGLLILSGVLSAFVFLPLLPDEWGFVLKVLWITGFWVMFAMAQKGYGE